MNSLRWALIALQIVIGVGLTAIGMFAGVWTASQPEQPGQPTVSFGRWIATVVGFTALYPTTVTLVIGWIGPRPHGNFWLTVFAGIAGAFLGCILTLASGKMRILALIGVMLPALSTTLVYNFAWLYPNAKLPISFF